MRRLGYPRKIVECAGYLWHLQRLAEFGSDPNPKAPIPLKALSDMSYQNSNTVFCIPRLELLPSGERKFTYFTLSLQLTVNR
jgi:hypothetical protein